MSLPPTTGDHLDTMFPTCTDLAPRIDGQYFGETVNATIAALGHTDTLINEYLAFADTVFYATAESTRTPPQYNGVYGAGMDSTEYTYGFAFSNYYPSLAPVPVPASLPTSAYVTEFAPSPMVKFAACGRNDAELSAWYSPDCDKWSDQHYQRHNRRVQLFSVMSQLWVSERAAHRVEPPLPKRHCRTRPGILGQRPPPDMAPTKRRKLVTLEDLWGMAHT